VKPPDPVDREVTTIAENGVGNPALNAGGNPCREISTPAVLSRQPLVSVKMRTYNHEPYIAQAIEGVLMQKTDFPIELVIGDDCSTDRTREIVLRYQDERPDIIRVILQGRNVGARRNSRKLDEFLRGKYTAFNDGDDYWTHPRKLQMQADIMETSPSIGLVHGGVVRQSAAGKECGTWKPMPFDYDDGDLFDKYLRGAYHVAVPAACVRTELYRAVLMANPDEFDGRFMMSDTQMWLELARITKFRFVNEPLVTYNVLPESVSRSGDILKEVRFWKSSLEMRLHYIDKYKVGGATERCLRHNYAERFRGLHVRARGRGPADSAMEGLRSTGANIGLRDLVSYWSARNALVRQAMRIRRKAIGILRHLKV
jgi:glycosyltransferase involved in cell wall biosynthesis